MTAAALSSFICVKTETKMRRRNGRKKMVSATQAGRTGSAGGRLSCRPKTSRIPGRCRCAQRFYRDPVVIVDAHGASPFTRGPRPCETYTYPQCSGRADIFWFFISPFPVSARAGSSPRSVVAAAAAVVFVAETTERTCAEYTYSGSAVLQRRSATADRRLENT